MRVGVYVDGFNLYNGLNGLSGIGGKKWKWLHIRDLASWLVKNKWPNAEIARIVYCTSRVKSLPENPDAPKRQATYIKALQKSRSVDWVEYGRFVQEVKPRPLALRGNERDQPILVRSKLPVLVKDSSYEDVPAALFYVSVADREEKGTDVNLTTHLLIDILEQRVDAAVVVSNDSDFGLVVREAAKRVPVGIAYPAKNLAGVLQKALKENDSREHWQSQIIPAAAAYYKLPDPCYGIPKPEGW